MNNEENTDSLQDQSSESVEMDCDRKTMIKRIYGVEDNHVLTKILGKFGLKFDAPMRWWMILGIGLHHLIVVYAFLTLKSPENHLKTILFNVIFGILSGIGITGGAHRYWAHKSFKAKFPLKVILLFLLSAAGPYSTLYELVKDHRLHHKYTETDADAFNTNRGYFFAHCGWKMLKQHPGVNVKAAILDFSEILNDPFVKFHNRYHGPLKLALCYALPMIIPIYFWHEQWKWSVLATMVRYLTTLHMTWSANSVAHAYGDKTYNKDITSVDSKILSIFTLGDGWHNYHHTFPSDYKSAEFVYYIYNWTTLFIDVFAKIGWAYDLKQPSAELIRKTKLKQGDGTYLEAKYMGSG